MSASRTKLPLVLWLGSALFVVYGTTIPFNFVTSRGLAYEHWSRVVWNPLISPDSGQRIPIPDFVSNILLFTPVGCFGVWALGRPRSIAGKIAALTIFSLLLSTCVEIAQLFTVDRVSSIADIVANTVGGLIGAIAGVVLTSGVDAIVARAAASGLTEPTTFFPFLMAAVVLCAGAWEPFDVTLDVGGLVAKVRLFLHDPIQFGMFNDEALSLLQHLLFTGTLVVWLKRVRVHSSVKIAATLGILMSLGCEGAQLFISARMPGLWDAGVGVIGALIGLAAGVDFWRTRRSPSPVRWCVGLVLLTAVGVAMQQLSPFDILHGVVRPFQWIPFLNYYAFTTSETVSHSAELLLSYLPLGFGVALAVRSRVTRAAAVTLLVLAIATPVEYLQRFIGGRFPDITDIGLSVAGGLLGLWIATRGWALFNAQLALLNPPNVARSGSSTR